MSICRVISCVVARGCLPWSINSLDRTVSLCPASFSTPSQTCLLLQVTLDFLLLHSNPLRWKGHPFLVLVLEGLVSLLTTIQLQLLQYDWLGHILGLLWYWMVCLGNKQRSFCCFEIAPKHCPLDSFVDYKGYFISSSKGFLLTVVDIMAIWIKFAPFDPF